MIERTLVKEALRSVSERDSVYVLGWVRTRRDAKGFSFVEVNDGSCLSNIQIVVDASIPDYAGIDRITTGAAIAVRGRIVASQGKGQKWEIAAESVELIGASEQSYPLQKKRHTQEFSAGNCPLAPTLQSFRMRLSHTQSPGVCNSLLLSGERLSSCPHANYHG